ncbi:MAG: hypothetical protein GY787_06110 [Alteromonadales bacterium]|nr:hypothetical protein [Alteromonadales bacterium]
MTINSERLDGVFVLANRWIGDKSVAAKLTILSSFFMVVLIGIVSYTIITLNQQSTDAEAINVAGRQRMLTQKFTKELFDELNNKQIVAFSERQTTAIATQIMEDRAYYSKNVIVKLREDRSKVFATPNYHNKSKAIPTPATFVQEASNELVKKMPIIPINY